MDSDFGIPRQLSDLQKQRTLYQPELPPCLQGTAVRVEFGDATTTADFSGANMISRLFPSTYGQPLAHFLRPKVVVPDAQIITELPAIRVGLVFCGRQSPGGHNVVWGLHDALKMHNTSSVLLGFVGGTEGLFAQKTLEITDEVLSTYKNQGGYDMLGRTKDQIRTTEQVNAALASCMALKLDGLVIIGGVTSNTDAAQLSETFADAKCTTKVVGVPVTLNGDLRNQFVETSVGFDTICKVNSQLISNVCTDALSAEKVILGEEVAASKLTLFDITKQICDAIQARAEQDKFHGVVLLPEGLIESIPEIYALLQLLLNPESDDSAQLSQIETEKLLAQLVETEMNKRMKEGTYKGKKFNAICHFFGYQARGSLPSKFDCDYAYLSNRIYPTIIGLLRNNATKFLMDDIYRNPGPLQFDGPGSDSKTVTLCVEDQDYMGRIKKLQQYLEEVRKIVKPGCSQEVLKAALSAMASVTDVLSVISAPSFGGHTY
ncbi:Pyrophosphate--fructose 6-phosphate 1-phosphotransferase subunit alpha [Acorus gramineus]|uniref:Pyrophosphate--fructose 6-phosphate 1-phosphotransferase subunit alpha n=1 Tax=Acorus gramineus TaxID=55184 RepID=A0AAV9ARF8_ACOGR|nr:Pyrophosphate--fructose 6-phosphate 1-phosphotransferase subunit alpha [Acorus gramineus]